MYASPRAAVITPAVPAEIAPPTTVPAPGINLIIFVTTVFPSIVAPPAPIDEDNSAVITLLFTSNPNITVIEAIIPTWVGINNAQSENGIGAAPSPAAATAAVATAACARRFFSSKQAI